LDPQAYPYIMLLGVLFGTTLLASRFSVGQYQPLTYLGLRLVIASLGHVAVYVLHIAKRGWPRDRHLWKHAIVLGVFTSISMAGIVSSLVYLSTGMTAIMITAGPAVTVILAHFFLEDEPLSWHKGIGVALAICGASLLVVLGETGLPDVRYGNPLGYALVMMGMLVASVSVIYVRKYMQDLDTFDVASARMIVAALLVMPISILLVGFDLSGVDHGGYLALLYAGIAGTFIGMMLQFFNIQRFGATAAVMVAYVIPVVATIGGALLLDEQITVGMLAGMALIAIGVWQINRR
jgi:drug/metabolite transporter (DMT)-like permease